MRKIGKFPFFVTTCVAKRAKIMFSQSCVTSTPGGGGGQQGPGHNTPLPPGPGHNTRSPPQTMVTTIPSLPHLGHGHNTPLPPTWDMVTTPPSPTWDMVTTSPPPPPPPPPGTWTWCFIIKKFEHVPCVPVDRDPR